MLDLLVIGAGLSGLLAAIQAARAGLQVRVVAKGLGALHWSAGTVDLLGYLPGRPDHAVERPLAAVDALKVHRPGHPYLLLGDRQLRAAMDQFVILSQEIGLPYGGASVPGRTLRMPSPVGAARPTFLAPQGQLGGDLSRPEPMLIVGFHGLRDFYPHLIAENLAKRGHQARAELLPLDLLTSRRDSNTVHLAAELENPDRRAALASALKPLIRPGERLGLPAVLGIDSHASILTDLQARTGVLVFEIPTLPPSVPGMRLFRALRDELFALGVRVEAGMEAVGFGISNSKIAWVETETSARPLRHRARAYLLASGGLLGGGFDSDHTGRVWETVFDLPLTVPQERAAWFRSSFLDPAGHPVFQGGVAVDNQFRPVDGSDMPIHDNLWACGSVLASADPIQERSLEGIAVATGVAAGQAIAQHLQPKL